MPDIYGRTGGPFLDQLELEARELKAARIEGRDPNFALQNLVPMGAKVLAPVTFEVDVNDEDAIDAAIEKLVGHKNALTVPSTEVTSLHPEIHNPNEPSHTVEAPETVIEGNIAASEPANGEDSLLGNDEGANNSQGENDDSKDEKKELNFNE